MNGNLIQALTIIAGVIGGAYVLIQKLSNDRIKQQETLFKFLTEKNGHNERIANRFDATIREVNKTLVELTKAVRQDNLNL